MQSRGKVSSILVRLKFSAQMAFGGITSNLLRTFLTVLGIAIGVAAVVSLMGIGEGARKSIVAQFESLGENVIVIKANADNVTLKQKKLKDLQKEFQLLNMLLLSCLKIKRPYVGEGMKVKWTWLG